MQNAHPGNALASLKIVSDLLNRASDFATDALRTYEKELLGQDIGLEYWYSIPIKYGPRLGDVGAEKTITRSCQQFGWARVDGKWCLAINSLREVEGFFEGVPSQPYREPFTDGPVSPGV